MSLCPNCGRLYCDHTADERGQTFDEMMAPLTPEEKDVFDREPPDSIEKIRIAKKIASKTKNTKAVLPLVIKGMVSFREDCKSFIIEIRERGGGRTLKVVGVKVIRSGDRWVMKEPYIYPHTRKGVRYEVRVATLDSESFGDLKLPLSKGGISRFSNWL